MKTIVMVQDLVRKAMDRGEAVINKKGQEVYRAASITDSNGSKHFQLIHYGTLILQAHVTEGFVELVGGYSTSDRDSINNALNILDLPGSVSIKQGKLQYTWYPSVV